MSSFFTLPASQRKRKREDRVAAPGSKKRGVAVNGDSRGKQSSQRQERDESISGSESEEDEGSVESGLSDEDGDTSDDSEQGETAADRRLKLAERYLDNIREEVDEVGFDAAEIDRDLIAERLKEDVDEAKGRLFRQLASQLNLSATSHSFFRADTQSTTAVAVHPPFAYTVSKDRTLIKWELATPQADESSTSSNGDSGRPSHPGRKKPKNLKFVKGLRKVRGSRERQGHTGNILSVAVSPSGRFVATGGDDKKLIIWDANTLSPMRTFTQHRDTVSSLAFTRHISSHSSGEQLFSGSFDRTIKTWSLSPGGHAYVETLFGHQDHVLSVASMMTDQCVSVGARDRTARLWKVIDETQLVFRGDSSKKEEYQTNNIECVTSIPPNHFVTGSDSGALSLWSVHKKKPLHTIQLAHGLDPIPPLDQLSPEVDTETAAHNARFMRPMPRWITALTAVPGTDIVLSGSWDGWIRAWQVSEDKRFLSALGPVGCPPSSPLSSSQLKQTLFSDNHTSPTDPEPASESKSESKSEPEPLLKGVINSIAVFERRPTSTSDEKAGLCIVAALGKEHRLSRSKCFENNHHNGVSMQGRNGAVVLEVPFLDTTTAVEHHE
ncbi:putative WD repeat-containing protein C2E1P5,05 [Talaromyces islandicus]|uniref:Putative WD repeat-containing protein C2E1P5,05 n=1 Tax=Talaromyces islandicus TaxID=28573 RepID=A0A0U1LY10_TALIS|nr:putative WD repeat-containing protein C2E1P5,05 [Talaromyces islandicus]